ncbi:hypothetical protein [Komagataeibacter nataicola]|uniref:hypothetical protein n=1 Tax=Komagataeibacter nataicola TaxID=265960 RepID=UPI0011B4B8D2|nr:hypothetical protein [Komagataeibacter nataicola]WNM08399.1 hypothetical protein RI056_16300 [Komagataeibacter nataicola]GBR23032.1 hypothetical protein AA0616_2425 [Komagataeibacter nataicola NRIC 0616]
MNNVSKTCFKCQQEKPLSEFYVHRQMLDGHLNKCKSCAKSDTRKNRSANKEYYLHYDRLRAGQPDRIAARRAYAQSEAGKEKLKKGRDAWQKNIPSNVEPITQ